MFIYALSLGVCCKDKVSPWRFAHSSLFLQLNLSRRKQDVWDFPSAGRYLKLQETPLKISLTFYSQAKDSHSEISFPESLRIWGILGTAALGGAANILLPLILKAREQHG